MSISGESRLLIDGKLVTATGGRTYPNVNPATEEVIGQVADATREDMDRAIGAARRAFDTTDWSTNLAKRGKCLRQLHAALEKHKEESRGQIIAEVGTPIMLTYAIQQDSSIADMLWDIECAEQYEWERQLGVREFFGAKSKRVVRREPMGVAGLITPWNFPLMLNLSKVVPALMAGCTAVLKAAPDTPWSATWLGKLIAEETELPPGVLNVVTARDPAEVGDQLTGDPRVDVISFTGSTVIGKHIMRRCADSLKRVFLELGGKSAQIFLDDTDLTKVVGAAGAGICTHGGQGCAITTRMLLPRSQYEACIEALKVAYQNLPYGDPTVMGNLMGPLINAKQRERVLGYIEKGKAEGAKCLVGGGRPAKFPKGWFVEPTLFVDVDPNATIAQEEIFGPVLSVIPYDTEEDAIRIANHSKYGLSGSVFAGSLDRAMGVAKRIRTGTLSVNGGMWFGADSPFGGYKESGIGREHGVAGFEEYLQIKTIGYPA